MITVGADRISMLLHISTIIYFLFKQIYIPLFPISGNQIINKRSIDPAGSIDLYALG